MWKRGGLQKKGEPCVYLPSRAVTHRGKGALLLAFVGPGHRQAKMEDIIAEMLFFLPHFGYAGISLVRNGRKVREPSSLCLLGPNWSWGGGRVGAAMPPKTPPSPHDKFTRHHFLRVLGKRIGGVVTARRRRGAKQRELNPLVNQLQTRRDHLCTYLNALNVSPRCFPLIGLIRSPRTEPFTRNDKRLRFP